MLAVLAIVALASAVPAAQVVRLTELSRSERARLVLETRRVPFDPAYRRAKVYEGYSLRSVLRLLRWKRSQTADYLVELVAADGYRATAPLALLLQHENEGLVAFRDAARPRAHPWATFAAGKQRITPAPFYLVWTRRDRRLPWPYQLTEIRLVESAAAFAAAVPRDPSALGGFELFRANCIACHSINLVGGAVGPELNVPRNVLEYWPAELFAPYVRNPASFRFRARMPSFEALSGDELRAIERYLAAMKDQKICDSIDACERAAGQ